MIESEIRKIRSEEIIVEQEIPINVFLPCIEESSNTKIRDTKEIVFRFLCLIVVALKAECLEEDILQNIINDYQLKNHFTEEENKFLTDKNSSEHDNIQNIWRYESVWTLLWAIHYVEFLSKPDSICDVGFIIDLIKSHSLEELIQNAKIRNKSEILDETDLIYRYHWAVVNARIKGTTANIKDKIDKSVIYERHYALNWITHYLEQEWDYVRTDT